MYITSQEWFHLSSLKSWMTFKLYEVKAIPQASFTKYNLKQQEKITKVHTWKGLSQSQHDIPVYGLLLREVT